MKFMYAAYAVTWIIHIAYLAMLTRGYRRVREELDDLRRR
jgi:CcmD family protein